MLTLRYKHLLRNGVPCLLQAFSDAKPTTAAPTLATKLDLMKDWLRRGDLHIETVKYSSSVKLIGLPERCSNETVNSELFQSTLVSVFNDDNTIVIKNDCSANIGLNRELARNFMEQQTGISQLNEEKQKRNPELPDSIDELYIIKNLLLHPEGFGKLLVDPTDEQSDQVINFHKNNPKEMVKRLIDHYNVHPHKGEFVQNGVYSSNEVVLGGLSELFMRRALMWNLSLVTLKTKFLEFAEEIKQAQPDDTEVYGAEWLKFTFSNLLVPIEDKFLYLILSRLKSPAVLICDTYNIPGLLQLKKNELLEDKLKIGELPGFVEFLRISKSKQVSEENDEVMLEKAAILDTIQGASLWSEPFIDNPFPFLSEDFLSLTKEEQQTIQERHKYHLSRYRSARRKLTE